MRRAPSTWRGSAVTSTMRAPSITMRDGAPTRPRRLSNGRTLSISSRCIVAGSGSGEQLLSRGVVFAPQARHQLACRHHGLDCCDALAAAPDVFPGLALATLAAGEVHPTHV